jgi:hypothetical protein
MGTAHVLAGIAWDPQIRGFLTLGVGVVVLLGSVYLLLLTNVGTRLGFLIAATAFWGWLFIMGSVWWIYGTVGMIGDLPAWHVQEVVYPGTDAAHLNDAHSLDVAKSGLPANPDEFEDLDPDAQQKEADKVQPNLGGWKVLLESNPAFGEAKATVDEHFASEPLDDGTLKLDSADDYVARYSFERGGKDKLEANPNRWDRISHKVDTLLQFRSPPHYAIVQIQPALVQETVPGQAPPLPKADESKPVVSVIMERDLGHRRTPGALLAVASGIMFGLLCVSLHRRDLRAMEARGLNPAKA